ncbi:MAG TPA: Lpg1974 family pore-forming outer membrane protein [Rhizomicrobium sp.]
MNELTTTRENQIRIRRALLATVSALALLGAANRASAADDGQPNIWIELSGQFAQEQADYDGYVPTFLAASPFVTPAASLERISRASWDGAAKFAFETDNGWTFSAAVRYGKTGRTKSANSQAAHASHHYGSKYSGGYDAYRLFQSRASESHAVLDFQAGKDVGLGSFGSSVLSAGVRFAQFNVHTNVEVQSQPTNINGYGYYHIFRAKFDAARHFNGIGPSLSWNASTNLFGNPSSSSIALDWGVNGAVLFGRQRVSEAYQTTDNYKHYFQYLKITTAHGGAPRSRTATVPNLGGFAGVSWRVPNARVSLGYRADFFFGAMDGGIDTAHRENTGFYGPFASVSIGLGG